MIEAIARVPWHGWFVAVYLAVYVSMFTKQSFRDAHRKWWSFEDPLGSQIWKRHPIYALFNIVFFIVFAIGIAL
ncbi:hypothetical protein [Actibacterium pelagium]|uniref:Uncharacterized protein n=1 Tax=Actibacterium pelagium TaxID=2029103 RepID=A0A917AE13_9RHOB|nr:hypothetical protein [Actibacterium pelagium]GGE46116.1 hypothetical protein GCM10011517_12270 [Actibacterium pelagium]